MVEFSTIIKKFASNGEKTGWTYIEFPLDILVKLNPGMKQSFRVKGKLDNYSIDGISLLPMGKGEFIMPLNATMRKGINKKQGAALHVNVELDTSEKQLSLDLVECLEDAPSAFVYFKSLTKSHQNYFSSWIESAKTDATKAKRIAQTIEALALHFGYPEMIRYHKKRKGEIG